MHFESTPRHVTPQIDCLGKTSTVGIFKEIDGKISTHIYGHQKNEHFEGFNTHLWFSRQIDGKTWIFQVHLDMWQKNEPQIDHLERKMWLITVLGISTHIYGVCKEIDGKTFIFRVHLGMWPLKSIISEKRALLWGFQHTFMGFLRQIDGKTWIFQVNLDMWLLKSIVLEKRELFWGFQHTFMGFGKTFKDVTPLDWENCSEGFNTHLWCFQGGGKTWIFQLSLGMVTPQIDCLEETSTVLRIYGVSKEIDGKTFIFRVNLGMWPLKSIVLEKRALFWGFQHTFMAFSKEIDGETCSFWE